MQFWGEGAGTRSGAWAALQHPAGLPLGRRLAGYFLTVVLAPLLTIVLATLRGQLTLSTDALALLVAVIAVALAGGLVPAVLEVVAVWRSRQAARASAECELLARPIGEADRMR